MLEEARKNLMDHWPHTKRTLIVIGQSRDGNFTMSAGSIEGLPTFLKKRLHDTYTLIDLKQLVNSSLLTKD